MKKILFLFMCLFTGGILFAQPAQEAKDDSWKKIYRGSATRINDLVHTKLDVKFDYDKSYMYGKAWITLKPHFYPTDSLALDAKGMDIHKIGVVKGSNNIALKYDYDGMILHIHLDRTYKYNENYTVYIDYTSKPNELKVQGSAAITDAKGLYFINPKGEEKDKPTQIWTQGETEANSAWFPTTKKVAGTCSRHRMSSICGVYFGSGPSSNVRTMDFGWKPYRRTTYPEGMLR